MGRIEIPIAAAENDSYWYTWAGACYNEDYIIIGGVWGDTCHANFRFLNSPVANIFVKSAKLRLLSTIARTPSGIVTIKMVKSLNPPAPTAGNCNPANHPQTTAYVQWQLPATGIGDTIYTPDFSSVLQEVVDQPGFAPGTNVMVLILGCSGGGDVNNITVEGYEHPGNNPAVLVVDYIDRVSGAMM